MRVRRILGVLVAAATLAAGCDLGGGGTPDAATVTTTPVVDPAASTQPRVAPSDVDICRDWAGLRTYAVDTGLLGSSGAADLPVPDTWDDRGFWTTVPFGDAGVAGVLGELTSASTICDYPPTAEAREAIDRYEAATDRVEARKILLEEVAAEVEPLGYSIGESSAAGPIEPKRAYVNTLFKAAVAAHWGDDETAARLFDLGASMFADDARASIPGSDTQELLATAASAQLLGLDELSDEALHAAQEIAKAEVEKRSKEMKRCAEPGSNGVGALVDAIARADALGTPNVSEADATPDSAAYDRDTYQQQVLDWEERQVDAARGEVDPECAGWVFETDLPLPPMLSGSLHVRLVNCDGRSWDGELTGRTSLDMGDGTLDMEQFFELHFSPMGSEVGARADLDLDGRLQWRMSGPDFSGNFSTQAATGKATFSIDGPDIPMGLFEATIDTAMARGQVTVDGETLPLSIPVTMGSVSGAAFFEQGGVACGAASR